MKGSASIAGKYRWRLLAVLVMCLCAAYLFLPDRRGPVSLPERLWEGVPASRWMEHVDGGLSLAEINLPGTHDSAACHMSRLVAPWARCQQVDIASQLRDGVRLLDLRLMVEWHDGVPRPRLCHGAADCYSSPQGLVGNEEDYLTMEDVLKDIYAFLQANPSEAVVLSLKEERPPAGGRRPFGDVVRELYLESGAVNPSTGKPFWHAGGNVPTLDEARGQIVLMRRYGGTAGDGLDFTGWKDNAAFLLKKSSFTARIEDTYQETGDTKWGAVLEQFRSGREEDRDRRSVLLTYTSANKVPFEGPRSVAEDINARLKAHSWQYGGRYGWIVADFNDGQLCRLIFATNKKAEAPSH